MSAAQSSVSFQSQALFTIRCVATRPWLFPSAQKGSNLTYPNQNVFLQRSILLASEELLLLLSAISLVLCVLSTLDLTRALKFRCDKSKFQSSCSKNMFQKLSEDMQECVPKDLG